ncbi:MAG: hypothetical protein BGN87_15165 [Rhizobiales bacterium 65-79]|nr:MAG: hypothetical protein BGN87_15165 [Rhizobiales bacterium 65-79]
MRSARRRSVRPLRTALLAGFLAFATASCTTNDANLHLATPGSSIPVAATIPAMMAEAAADHAAGNSGPLPTAPTGAGPSLPGAETGTPAQAAAPAATAADTTVPDDPPLPDVVAYVPTPNPENPFTAAMPALENGAATADGITNEEPAPVALPETAIIPVPSPAGGPLLEPADTSAANVPTQAAAYAEPAMPASVPRHRGFFATLFASSPAGGMAANASGREQPLVEASLDAAASKPLIDQGTPAKPIVDLSPTASAAPHGPAGNDALPGVRSGNTLFEITRKSGGGDNSDVDINETDGGPVELASAAGMARIDPHGLILQRDTVDTACLRPTLLSELRKIEEHYGRKLIVTSGYRSPVHNVAAHGALNSLHLYCAAADVQMPGVSKWELAAYVRSMPGRGGVGTYCYTNSVHIDIGPERDWNWRCRRSRHRG